MGYSAEMAQTPEPVDTKKAPSAIGRRIAAYRKYWGWTAERLASEIPNEDITRGLIANIESGRKRDLTSTELMLIASGLDISPLSLLVDLDEPYAPLPDIGLAAPYKDLNVTEYAMSTSLYAEDLRDNVDRLNHYARIVMVHLVEAETIALHIAEIEAIAADPDRRRPFEEDENHIERFRIGAFHSFGVTPEILLPDHVRARKQDLVDAYRDLLTRLPGGLWGDQGDPPTADIRRRVDKIRTTVVEFLEQDPTLDREEQKRSWKHDPRGIPRDVYGPAIRPDGSPLSGTEKYANGDPDEDDGDDVGGDLETMSEEDLRGNYDLAADTSEDTSDPDLRTP